MRFRVLCFSIVLVFALSFFFASCGSDDDDDAVETPLSSYTYSGADPKGDFIAITIDGAAKTVTHHNYTTGEENGPYTYSKLTDSALNGGFSNMYITEVFETNKYALFVIADGAAIIFQLFNTNDTAAYDDDYTEGTPGYAFVRKDMSDLLAYKGTAYNWISFKMGDADGNFEAGFAGFDTDTDGTFYGASYNNRAENEGWTDFTNGIKDINENGDLTLDVFTYNSADMSHTYSDEELTLIPNQNDDFVLDFGENNGAGFAIEQADSEDWQTAYNGTYLLMVYSNNDEGDEQEIEPMKLVLSSGSTAGQGYFQVYPFGGSSVAAESDLVSLKDSDAKPGGTEHITDQFEDISGCAGATSTVVQNACNAQGGFIAIFGDNDETVLFSMIDPSGNYMFFTLFRETGTDTYEYSFGLGVK